MAREEEVVFASHSQNVACMNVATCGNRVGRFQLQSAIKISVTFAEIKCSSPFQRVLEANSAADQVFDDDIRMRGRRLIARGQQSKDALDKMLDQLRITPDSAALPVDPIVVPRRRKRPLLIRILPVGGAARSPFLGARALLFFFDLQVKSGPQPQLLSRVFGLSRSEAKLAAVVAAGYSPQEAAAKLGIARKTARNQLKAVFAKTGTHRQGELIALLSVL